MPQEYWGFIKDPIYGYIQITGTERSIIDTRPVQRLRRLRQLAGSEYVYPGANHTRFEHSLGVMHLAGVLSKRLPVGLKDDEIETVMLAGLLHDVGHGPFSHVFEPLLIRNLEKTHEDLTTWIVEESELADVIQKEGYDPHVVGRLAAGRLNKPRMEFMDQIIRSTIDVDKMDFIVRDSYHTGAEYGRVDISRLIYTMDLLDGNLAVDATAIPTLEAFLIARMESFRTIYFHRVARAVQIMLEKALEKANDELKLTDFDSPEEYLSLDDYTVWSSLRTCKKSKEIIRAIEERRLLKNAYEKVFFTRDKLVTSIFTNETVRDRIEEEIATKARVKPEHVTIDVPSLPSVPYYHSVDIEPMDIPVFYKTKTGERVPQRLEDLSRVIGVLRVFMSIVRVYTEESHRGEVAEAAKKVFGALPSEAKVSF